MDIWGWVTEQSRALRAAGELSLAQAMNLLPSYTGEHDYAAVDSLLPEALARARSLNLPWVEVYLRHWGLQSRVFHRQDATALAEAASLVERSHRADARDCPQSVCSVQDLAAAYGIVDGPAYSEERIAVSRETLARIDPRWPCFDCIQGELASALEDAGRPAEGLAVLEAAAQAFEATGSDREAGMASTRIRLLNRLGRFEDARVELVRDAAHGRQDSFAQIRRRSQQALVECRLGHTAEALAALPSPDEMADSRGNYSEWAEAVTALVDAGALAFPGVISDALHRHSERLADGGAHRNAFDTRLGHARLALKAGMLFTAERGAQRLVELLGRLVKPLGADVALSALQDDLRVARAARQAAQPSDSFETPEAALVGLDTLETVDEPTLDRIEAAAARWPEDASIAIWRARLWGMAGFGREALAGLWPRFEAGERTVELTITLGALHYGQKDDAGLARLADRLDATVRAAPSDSPVHPRVATAARWFQARRARDAGNAKEAFDLAREVHAAGVQGARLLTMLAQLALELGRPEDALRFAGELDSLVPGDREAAWTVVIAATWLGDWPRVREAGAVLGVSFDDTEGPAEDPRYTCLVRSDSDGRQRDLFALRLGLAQAEILEVRPHGTRPQRGDRVVIQPTPLNSAPPEDDEEAQGRHLWIYPVLGPLRPGNFWAFAVDGPKPADLDWQDFVEAIRDLGGEVDTLSSELYRLEPLDAPEDAAPVPGIFARAALPPDVSASEVLACFDRCLGERTRPFVPELAHHAGDADRVRHELELGRLAGVDFDS